MTDLNSTLHHFAGSVVSPHDLETLCKLVPKPLEPLLSLAVDWIFHSAPNKKPADPAGIVGTLTNFLIILTGSVIGFSKYRFNDRFLLMDHRDEHNATATVQWLQGELIRGIARTFTRQQWTRALDRCVIEYPIFICKRDKKKLGYAFVDLETALDCVRCTIVEQDELVLVL